MTDSDRSDQLLRYLTGELPPDARRAVEAELERSPAMRRELASWRRLRNAVAGAATAREAGEWPNLEPILERAESPGDARWGPDASILRGGALLGVLLLLIFGSWWLTASPTAPGSPVAPAGPSGSQVAAEAATRRIAAAPTVVRRHGRASVALAGATGPTRDTAASGSSLRRAATANAKPARRAGAVGQVSRPASATPSPGALGAAPTASPAVEGAPTHTPDGPAREEDSHTASPSATPIGSKEPTTGPSASATPTDRAAWLSVDLRAGGRALHETRVLALRPSSSATAVAIPASDGGHGAALPPGSWWIYAEAWDRAALPATWHHGRTAPPGEALELAAGERLRITLDLVEPDPAAVLVGRLLGESGDPLPATWLVAADADGVRRAAVLSLSGHETAGAQGRYRLVLPPGRYRLGLATSPTGSARWWPGEGDQNLVELRAGRHAWDLRQGSAQIGSPPTPTSQATATPGASSTPSLVGPAPPAEAPGLPAVTDTPATRPTATPGPPPGPTPSPIAEGMAGG